MKKRDGGKKVIVGLSGGVDSATAAALLKQGGYDVQAVHFQLSDKNNAGHIRDAKKISAKLGIKIKIVDARKKFQKEVVDYFLKEYESGRTPNPCVMCNPAIKFKFLLDEMQKEKADRA